jgi:type I restriction enzyme, S subunit
MSRWREVRLSDLVEIKHGFAFKGEFFRDEPTENFLITPGNFAIGGGFQWGKSKYYLGPVPSDFVLNPGDIIVTMTDLSKEADTLGYGAIVPVTDLRLLHNQRIGKVVTKSSEIDPKFLHWVLRSRDYRNEILANYTGSTVKQTSPSKIGAHRFNLPPLADQQAIAAVLDALDDKIELNRRMNRTLEAMARALFRSWFVDFDPVHAKAEDRAPAHMDAATAALFPDRFGEDGLPEGWRKGRLDDVAEAPRLGIAPSAVDPTTPYIGLEHMPRRSIALAEWNEAASVGSQKSVMRAGDFLFGKLRPYFHKVGVAPIDGVCSTEVVVVRPRTAAWAGFVLCVISSDDFVDHTNASSSGTRMPRTSWADMSRYQLTLPGVREAGAFEGVVQFWRQRIMANVHQTRTLGALRDALLPKLMSGELSVREAERAVAEVA